MDYIIPPTFGAKEELSINKAWTYNQRWEILEKEKLLKLTVADLVASKGRFVIELKIEGQTCRVLTWIDDYEQVKLKYPNDLTIHLSQLYQLFTKNCTTEDIPRVLIPLGIFNAKVEKRI